MTKKNLVIPLCVLILVTLACSIGYVDNTDPDIGYILDKTATAESYSQSSAPVRVEPTPGPTPKADVPQSEVTQPKSGEINEYSVSATNFTCTCQVDGNVTSQLTIKGDQLEHKDSGGGVLVYDKIGDNRYRRSWMGYYILESGEGDNKTETKVDEERSVVIILTNDGYVMEHYQGSDSSPCCLHTFTNTK
jgi:hypothetical protein